MSYRLWFVCFFEDDGWLDDVLKEGFVGEEIKMVKEDGYFVGDFV